jgi:hypothetical protein
MKNCRTCLLQHDDEIHGATERVHNWLRERIQRVTGYEKPEGEDVMGEPSVLFGSRRASRHSDV